MPQNRLQEAVRGLVSYVHNIQTDQQRNTLYGHISEIRCRSKVSTVEYRIKINKVGGCNLAVWTEQNQLAVWTEKKPILSLWLLNLFMKSFTVLSGFQNVY
jgi:hypothetical protein